MTKPQTKPQPKDVQSLFLSDFHIGYKGFDALAVRRFIEQYNTKYLFLVGDIFDGWKLEKRWHWTKDCTDLIDSIIAKKRAGTKIIFLPGNHDEKIRDFLIAPVRYYLMKKIGIRIENSLFHETLNGKRYLVLHGDQFDRKIIRGTSKFLDRFYDRLMGRADIATINPKRWSLGKAIASNGSYLLNRLMEASALRAMRENVDGVIYGHSHIPMLEDRKGKTIANCGSWIMSKKDHIEKIRHTALLETGDGHLKLADYPASPFIDQTSLPPQDIHTIYPETRRIIQYVHALWCDPSILLRKGGRFDPALLRV